MGPAWMFAYAAPFVPVAFVAAVFVARNLPDPSRRLIVAAAILLSSLGWTLCRTEGIDGDHNATFAWRWSITPEQRLLARPIPTPAAPRVEHPAEPTPTQPAAPVAELKPAALPAAAPEWPGFRGPNRDSVVPGVTIATAWTQSPPVELWRKPVGPGWSSFAVQGRLAYTQEQRGEEELVTAYNAATGDPVWSHADRVRFFESNAGAGPRATPTLSGGRVYTLGATGILNVLDAATGQRLWSRDTTADTKRPIPDWGFSASPIVTQGLVIVYAGRLAAYEAATGNLKWLGESVGGSYSSPHLANVGGVEQLLILSPQGAAALHPATGAQIWSHHWKGLPIIQPTLIPGGGILISAAQSEGTRRIDPVQGPTGWTVDTRWTSLALKPYFNDTVVHKGHAYGFDARILACIGLDDGKRIWKGGRYGNGQMLLLPDQDLLLILSEDGDLALVRASPSEFTEVAKVHALDGKTWNHPVLASGLLLVRNAQEMAAFRLPAAGR
ncbi:MAG: PQQ-like beta-propeller repeat protein [Acidobacteria bacterium]|nr:PQQ-like beta-propeller repeat protein [Acidobacteriota bacterium]